MKQLLVLVLATIVLTSCQTVAYQVYEVQSSGLTQKDNSLVFENEDCRVSYNLWGVQGSMAFIFENKSGRDIFIDLSQSFFIKNGAAFDYFKDRSYETRSYVGVEEGYSVSRTYIDGNGYWPLQYYTPLTASVKGSVAAKAGVSKAVTEKEREYLCIPANAFKVIDIYRIYPTFVQVCDTKIDFPKTSSIVKTYTESSSPLKFSNRLAYSFEEGNKSLKFIDNSFWLSSVKNYTEKEAIGSDRQKECYSVMTIKKEYFKIGAPNQFYVVYDMSR